MGLRIGTVNGKPFLANRTKTPLYRTVSILEPSTHYRYLLQAKEGQFWSPVVKHQCPATPGTVRLICDPLILEIHLVLDSVLLVDLVNETIMRPIDFRLPWEAYAGDEIQLGWRVKC